MIIDSLVTIGRDASYLQANGPSSDWEWWSEPFTLGSVDDFSLQVNPLTETPVAMLFVPSTSSSNGAPSKIGILYVAQTPGVSTVAVVHEAPSGGTTSVSVAGNVITVSAATGATNEQVSMIVNQSSAAFALVKAFPVGWEPNGPVLASFEADIEYLARTDVVLAFTQTTLGNNAAAANQDGTASVDFSNDFYNWQPLTGGSANVAAGSPPAIIQVSAGAAKYARMHWLPNAGSVGQIGAVLSGSGAVR